MTSITQFSDGYKAYQAGKKRNANPYPPHAGTQLSLKRVKWDGGWQAAERDAKREQARIANKEAAR